MKYEVGDIITVRKDLHTLKQYGDVMFVESMNDRLGEKVTIQSVWNGFYNIKEDRYSWSDEMFKETFQDIKMEDLHMETLEIPVKFNVGDKVYTTKQVKIEKVCDTCESMRVIKYKDKFIKCPECMGKGIIQLDKSKYVVCDDLFEISSLKISVNKQGQTIKYKGRCGILSNYLNRQELNLFATKEEAQASCNELNKTRININLVDIIIQDSFKSTIPSSDKLKNKFEYYKVNNKFADEVIIDKDNVLQDGYINYLICKMLDVDNIKVVVEG